MEVYNLVSFIDPIQMPHEEFVNKYRSRKISLTVNTNAAGYLFQSVLADHASKQANYRAIFFGGIIVGIISIFFVGWWSLLAFLVGIIGHKLSSRHTDRSVIAKVLESEFAYHELAEARIIALSN